MSRMTLFAVAALLATGCSLFSEDSYNSEGSYPLPDLDMMVGTWTRSSIDTMRAHPRADSNLLAYDTLVFERRVTLRYMPDSTGWYLWEPQAPCDSSIYDGCRAVYGWLRAHISDYDSTATNKRDPATMQVIYKRVNQPPRWCEYQREVNSYSQWHPCMEVDVADGSLLLRWTSFGRNSTLAEYESSDWYGAISAADFHSLGIPATRDPVAEFTRSATDLIVPLVDADSVPIAMEDVTDSIPGGVYIPGYGRILEGAIPFEGDPYIETWRTVVR